MIIGFICHVQYKIQPRQRTAGRFDATMLEQYASLSKLLQEFTDIPTIDKAWTFKSDNEDGSHAMFSISQPNTLANKKRKSILSSHILQKNSDSITFQWAPFPVEVIGVSAMVPSPSGTELLIIRNPEDGSPAHFEIWGPSNMKKDFVVARSVHGSVYTDGWFEGISWNSAETAVAYVAEESNPPNPHLITLVSKLRVPWRRNAVAGRKGQGDWEEDWGETYIGKRRPTLFVIDVNSGEVRAVEGVGNTLSVGQVVWSPSTESQQYLVFVGWLSCDRKLGMKYCYNRPCFLCAVKAPSFKSEDSLTSFFQLSSVEIPLKIHSLSI